MAVVKPGRIIYEMEGVPESVAREAMKLAAAKLPLHTKFVMRLEKAGHVMKATEQVKKIRDMSADELKTQSAEMNEQMFRLRFQMGHGTDGISEEDARASQGARPVGNNPSREGKGKIEDG